MALIVCISSDGDGDDGSHSPTNGGDDDGTSHNRSHSDDDSHDDSNPHELKLP
jgi:hypothetical protein